MSESKLNDLSAVTQTDLFDEGYSTSLSQWYTPSWLAERVVAWALQGVDRPLSILEPSAGLGALIRPIPAQHRVTAIEIDQRRIAGLRLVPQIKILKHADFLTDSLLDVYDLAITNPPYENGQDVKHVSRALVCCDRVVAILRLSALSGVRTHEVLWSRSRLTRMAITSSRPLFEGPKAMAPTGGTVIVELRPKLSNGRGQQNVEVEWW